MKEFHSSPGVPASRSGLDNTNSKIHLRLPSALTPLLITLAVLLATCQFIDPAHGFNSYSCLNSKPLAILSQPRIGRGAPIRTSRSQLSLSSTPDEASTAEIDLATKTEIRNIANYLAKQSLESLLTQSEANAIADELFFASNGRSSPIFNDSSYERYVKYWNKLEQRLREETERTPADILGKDLTNRILSSLRGDDDTITNNRRGKRGTGGTGKYDPQTVKTFLESEAVNSLFSKLLYDAIFEFTVKFDFIGNFISGLPLLGPVRNQVLKESKRQLDRTLGPLVQRFLSGYTRVAIRQAVDFVVSEENASAFGKANARLVGYLLEKRTVAEWVPETETLVGWREELWAYLVGLETGDGGQEGMGKEDQKKLVEQSLRWTYDLIGDKCVNDAGLDVNEILDSSPTLERKLGSFWQQCQESSKGTL